MPGDQSVASVDHSLAGDGEIAQTVDVVPRSRIVRLLGQTADTRSEMNRICKVSRTSEPSRDLVENNVQHSQKRKYLSNGRTCTNHLLRDNMQKNNIKMSERLNELLFSRVSNIFPRLPCFCKTAVRSVGQPLLLSTSGTSGRGIVFDSGTATGADSRKRPPRQPLRIHHELIRRRHGDR